MNKLDPYELAAKRMAAKIPGLQPIRETGKIAELAAPYTYYGSATGSHGYELSTLPAGALRDILDSANPKRPAHEPPTIMPIVAVTETTRIVHRNHHGGQGLVKIWRGGRQVTLYQCATPLRGDGPRVWLRNEIAERVPMPSLDELWSSDEDPPYDDRAPTSVWNVGGLHPIERYHQCTR